MPKERKPKKSAAKSGNDYRFQTLEPSSLHLERWGKIKSRLKKKRSTRSSAKDWLSTMSTFVTTSAAISEFLLSPRKHVKDTERTMQSPHNPAHAEGEGEAINHDQTRNAGKKSMRDDQGPEWDNVDEMLDASFPSSDPPSFNPGST
jgi:hypothetical protein